MSDDPQKTRYAGKQADVTWDGRLCIHVGECVRTIGRGGDSVHDRQRPCLKPQYTR